MLIGNLLNQLKAVKRQADGSYLACCPTHDDKKASLHITPAEDRILVKCHAGCATENICQALGIEMSDLFIDQPQEKRKIVATYSYHDEQGQELYQVVRYEPKAFSQRHKNGSGEWVWNLDGVRRVLYHLDEILIAEDLIYFVEGEKDADNLWNWRRVATTSPGGAGNWKPEYAQYLKGKRVCVIPDKDDAGFGYATKAITDLLPVVGSLYHIVLPGEDVKDVSDWLEQGGDIEALEAMMVEVKDPNRLLRLTNTDKLTELAKTYIPQKTDKNFTNTDMSVNEKIEKRGKIVWPMVNVWLDLHKGEKFDLDTICRHLGIVDRDSRHSVSQKLAYEVSLKNLRKSDRLYIYINKTFKLIDWVNASSDKSIALKFPYGIDDNSSFGFDGHVTISPGDIIVLAGVSNMGKTCFCLNLLWENMDTFPCTLMGNEYAPAKFKRRVSRMTWQNPLKEDGTPKFELIERHSDWEAIIRPDNINIIDWINLGDNFYQIGKVIEDIKEKLHNGIAVISLQKSEGKALGLGGGFSEHLASLYLTFDFERLTVRKAKEWHTKNPNGKMYGFTIVEGGSYFHNIREIKSCSRCYGKGTYRGQSCEDCQGSGYKDVD